MPEPMTFPPGVLTGVPFATSDAAASWLAQAFAGTVAGHGAGAFPYLEPRSPAADIPPINPPSPWSSGAPMGYPWPTRVPTVTAWPTRVVWVGFTPQGDGMNPDRSTALEWADGPPEAAGINSRTITGADFDGPRAGVLSTFVTLPGEVIGFLPAPGAPTGWIYPVPLRWAVLLLVTSWHNACRRVFDAADKRTRPILAKPLGGLEAAVADAADDFTTAANVWVTAVWADACTDGLNPLPTDPHSTPTPAPAGMFTLHTA